MQARLSSSLILCREYLSSSFQILMIRRKKGLNFSGALVFPGGSVDEEDLSPAWHKLLGCTTDSIKATPYSSEIDLTALRIAAIRETLEEIGVLLASGFVSRNTESFLRSCQNDRVRPSIEKLYYLTRIIAPKTVPKRFDTTFFLAIEDQQEIIVDNRESDAFVWGTPLFFLEEFMHKRIELWPPQIYILKELSEHRSLRNLYKGLAGSHRCPLMFQIESFKENEIIGVLPGDYRHESTPEEFRNEEFVHCLNASSKEIVVHRSPSAIKFLNSFK